MGSGREGSYSSSTPETRMQARLNRFSVGIAEPAHVKGGPLLLQMRRWCGLCRTWAGIRRSPPGQKRVGPLKKPTNSRCVTLLPFNIILDIARGRPCPLFTLRS